MGRDLLLTSPPLSSSRHLLASLHSCLYHEAETGEGKGGEGEVLLK